MDTVNFLENLKILLNKRNIKENKVTLDLRIDENNFGTEKVMKGSNHNF